MITRSLLGAAMCLASSSLMAATVTVSTSIDTGLVSPITDSSSQISGTASSSIIAANGNPNYYAQANSAQNGNMGVATRIDYSYAYNSDTSAFNNTPHTNIATATWSDTYTNTGSAQQLNLNFNVINGEIGYTSIYGEEAYSAGYGIRVLVDGQTVWSATDQFGAGPSGSNPFASYDASVLTYSSTPTQMFTTIPTVISFDNYAGQVGLGLLNNGDSVNITYEMSVFATSNYFIGNDYIYAQFGDPLAITPAISVSAVPVPAAAWLFGSGLIGLVGMARRKQQS